MGLFWQNNETNEDEDGELENMSAKFRQKPFKAQPVQLAFQRYLTKYYEPVSKNNLF